MIILIVSICLNNLNCSLNYNQGVKINDRLKIEKIKGKEKVNHGFLKIIFPEFRNIMNRYDVRLHEKWYPLLYVNGEKYFFTDFLGSEDYTIPLPVCKFEIKYELYNQWNGGSFPIEYQTGGGWQIFTDIEKIINIEIKESKTVTLNIVKSSKPNLGVGCCLGLPIPTYIQDVSFEPVIEVEKVEDVKPENLNNTRFQ